MLKMKEKEIGEVLVIEDDKIFATVHNHMLKRTLGCEPKSFMNAEAAIEFLDSEKNKNRNSLVLLDLNMPGMNGWDFLEAIREKEYRDQILVIIVTSSLFWEDYNRSKDYEQVIAYFTKPLKKEKLEDLLNRKNLVIKGSN